MVIVIVMADAFAFKAEARGEALVPGGVLFVFIAALSRDRMRLGSAMLLVGAGILAVIALRNLHDRSRQVELTANRGRPSLTWPAAVGAAVAIALAAGVIGPRIPGADADPLYQTARSRRWHHVGGQPARRHPLAAREPRRLRTVPHELGHRALLAADDAARVRRAHVQVAEPQARSRRRHRRRTRRDARSASRSRSWR